MLRLGAALLVLWGTVTIVAGVTAGREHPAAFVAPAFIAVGALIAIGGLGFALRKPWALALSAVALAALSLIALVSGYLLRGWTGMRISHHAARLVISSGLLAIAVVGQRQQRPRHS